MVLQHVEALEGAWLSIGSPKHNDSLKASQPHPNQASGPVIHFGRRISGPAAKRQGTR